MSSLLQNYQLPNLTLPNRVVMAPMTRVRATVDGHATPSMATYYAQRASAGLIVTEGVAPVDVGQSGPLTPGLFTDEQAASWQPVTDAVHTNGGRIFAQLMHGGRVGHPDVAGWHPLAPSAVALGQEVFTTKGPQFAPVPRELSTSEVSDTVKGFALSAQRAIDAGFDGIELHGANGYLIQQFLATGSNLRTDHYGGSITSRIRFAVEVAEAVADTIGNERVGIRLSPGGTAWNTTETDVPALYRELFNALAPLELAYVHVLDTTDETTMLDLRKAWHGTFIVNPGGQIGPVEGNQQAAHRWLERGADLVSFGRAFISNPDLVERFRLNLPLSAHDSDLFYQGGDQGYLDYPTYQH